MRKYFIGADEAGRGPLAGPVAVAVVCAKAQELPFLQQKYQQEFGAFKDSKKLTPAKREKIYQWIKSQKEFFYAFSFSSAGVIDKKGIKYALQFALNQALKKVLKTAKSNPEDVFVYLDANLSASSEFVQESIIKGDEKNFLISLASVVAKVERDNYMKKLDKRFPQYEFGTHKGYGTAKHISLIKKHGLSPQHRKTFCTRIVAQ